MSNDLISRKTIKAQIDTIRDCWAISPYVSVDDMRLYAKVFNVISQCISDCPTAFDMEKVVEEIQREGDIAELHQLNLLYAKKADDEEHFKRMQFELDRGYSVAMFIARKIVEKGGIE